MVADSFPSSEVWYGMELGDFILKNAYFSEEIKNSNKKLKFYITLYLNPDGSLNSANIDNPKKEMAQLEKEIIKAISCALKEIFPQITISGSNNMVRFPLTFEFD